MALPQDPTTTLIMGSIQAVTGIATQVIGGAQANKAARDAQTFQLDSQKEENRIASVKASVAFNQDLRNKRFSEQESIRQAEAEAANPMTTQMRYLLWGGGGLAVVVLIVMLVFITNK